MNVPADNENPVLDYCPDDISEDAAPGQVTRTISWLAANATDNSGTVIPTASHAPGSDFMLGTTTVTYTFRDPSGNDIRCSFDVVVNGTVSNSVGFGCSVIAQSR